MPDTQIVAAQVAAAPLVYQLPPSVEFTLKAVNADFDGSGSAASWLPAVVIASDSGHVVAYALDQGVSVAAGGDAAVSFFPGVKHAAGGTSGSTALDWSSPEQVVPLFEMANNGVWHQGFGAVPTVDAACLHAGRWVSSGTLDDFVAMRFGLSPFGSVWAFNIMHTTGPDHADLWGYLARLPDDDSFAGASDPTNLLAEIDDTNADFTYVLAFKLNGYSAVLTRNVRDRCGLVSAGHNPYASTPFRITGTDGAAFTTPAFDANLNIYTTGDGGAGVYALKIVAGSKVGASTSYKIGLQSVSVQRQDAIWA